MEQVSLGMARGQLVLLARSEHRAGVLAGWDTPFPGYSWAVKRHQVWPAGTEVQRCVVQYMSVTMIGCKANPMVPQPLESTGCKGQRPSLGDVAVKSGKGGQGHVHRDFGILGVI